MSWSLALSALEQKKIDESKEYRAIDYDAPVESDPSTTGLSTKIGIGGAIVVFGLVFALGDFLPTGSDSPIEEATIVNSKRSEEERTNLQTPTRQKFHDTRWTRTSKHVTHFGHRVQHVRTHYKFEEVNVGAND
ncbi:hypothetical protein CsSME_00007764 [Camellia sinensis var. sinensis]